MKSILESIITRKNLSSVGEENLDEEYEELINDFHALIENNESEIGITFSEDRKNNLSFFVTMDPNLKNHIMDFGETNAPRIVKLFSKEYDEFFRKHKHLDTAVRDIVLSRGKIISDHLFFDDISGGQTRVILEIAHAFDTFGAVLAATYAFLKIQNAIDPNSVSRSIESEVSKELDRFCDWLIDISNASKVS